MPSRVEHRGVIYLVPLARGEVQELIKFMPREGAFCEVVQGAVEPLPGSGQGATARGAPSPSGRLLLSVRTGPSSSERPR